MKKFIFLVLHYIGVPFVVLSFVCAVLKLNGKIKKYQKVGEAYASVDRYKVVYKLCKKLLFIKHIKIRSKGFGEIPKKPVLFIINHKSQIDVVVLIKLLYEQKGIPYFSFISKIENKKSWIVRCAMEIIDTIYIVRGDLRQQFESYQTQTRALNNGKSVVIFPEGTRIYGHEIGEFKPATLKVALKSFVPIVPITIYGSSGLFDSNKQFRNKNKIVYVEVLNIWTHNSYINIKEEFLSEQIRESIANKYHQIHELDINNKPIFEEK